MVELIRRYRVFIFVPLGMLIAVLGVLFALGWGGADDVAFMYQIF